MEYTTQNGPIRTEPKPACDLCGSYGEVLYRDCEDHIFGVPGSWIIKQCPNSGCGLIWLDPMPTRGKISEAYNKYYTHKKKDTNTTRIPDGIFKRFEHAFRLAQLNGYFALRYQATNKASALEKLVSLIVFIQPARKAAFDFKAMYIRCKPGARLLDIGCGNGEKMEVLQEMGWQVEGLDIDPAAVKIVSDHGLTAHIGSLEKQCFPDQQFDAIISSHVIEHVHNPVGLLRECGRVLKPGCKLVVVTPNSASWGHRYFGASWFNLDPPRHLHIFNLASLRRAAEDAGLIVCTLTSSVRYADGVFRASRSIQNGKRNVWNEHYSWIVHKWSRVLQWVEWLLLHAGLNWGEELIMICESRGKNGRCYSR